MVKWFKFKVFKNLFSNFKKKKKKKTVGNANL